MSYTRLNMDQKEAEDKIKDIKQKAEEMIKELYHKNVIDENLLFQSTGIVINTQGKLQKKVALKPNTLQTWTWDMYTHFSKLINLNQKIYLKQMFQIFQ